jgi:hypothetical protein
VGGLSSPTESSTRTLGPPVLVAAAAAFWTAFASPRAAACRSMIGW